MIVKAEIQSIDFTGNTCIVRMPIFESAAGGDKAVMPAIISTIPGIYNGYKDGDVVLVAFENGQLQNPCVIGKLYLGSAKENEDARGTVNCSDLISKVTNILPLDTKIESTNTQLELAKSATTYKTLADVVNQVYLNSRDTVHLDTDEQIIGGKTFVTQRIGIGTTETPFAALPELFIAPAVLTTDQAAIDKNISIWGEANTESVLKTGRQLCIDSGFSITGDLKIGGKLMNDYAQIDVDDITTDSKLKLFYGYDATKEQYFGHDASGRFRWYDK